MANHWEDNWQYDPTSQKSTCHLLLPYPPHPLLTNMTHHLYIEYLLEARQV